MYTSTHPPASTVITNQLSPSSHSGGSAVPTYALPYTATFTPTDVREITLSTLITPDKMSARNIKKVKTIVETYYQIHTYNRSVMYACSQMSQDVWDMIETQGINAIINVGNVSRNINSIQEADHTWVLAEVSPGEWIAVETTGGYLVCSDPDTCASNNPRYYTGWNFKTPKELQDYLNNHLGCSEGYVPEMDNRCHLSCSVNTYCADNNSTCVEGQCIHCSPGYYFGTDFQCHVIL
jgi:hypothetical protein